MEERATGLILRQRPLSETSLIVQWLTPTAGRISTVAKGARRPKSPFRGKLDLFFLADFSFNRSRRSDLHALREVMLRQTHARLRHEMGWLQQAAYATHLVELATESETPIPEIYGLMNEWFAYLPQQPASSHGVLAFELKLLALTGLRPDTADLRLSPACRSVLDALAETPWPALGTLALPTPVLKELSVFLNGFLAYHLGRVPRSRQNAVLA